MNRYHGLRSVALAAALIVASGALAGAQSQGTVKIGLIGEFSGPFQAYGKNIENGMMTPSLKVRRHVVRQFYADELAGLYEKV